MRFTSLKAVFIPLALLLFSQQGFSQTEEENDAKFASTELLVETFIASESQAVKDAEAAVEDAEVAVADATAGSPELIEAENALEAAKISLEQATLANSEETDLITDLVGKLSEEQILAFNRSLNNSLHNQFPVDLNADILQAALDGEYDKKQIIFLTKAYEEEAKFLSLAEKFEAKAEETGDDKFLRQADRMTAKAETSKEKFLSRIDRDNSDISEGENLSRQESREASREARAAAKETAQEARIAAKETAREARDLAKDVAREARDAAKEAAKEAREAARENARENAKENSRGSNDG